MKNIMSSLKNFRRRRPSLGMTLMEILIVVSLIGMISIAIYRALANGIKIWERNRQLLVEEDIAIFFDKFNRDIRNSFIYSKIKFEGNDQHFVFPTMVHTLADKHSRLTQGEYYDQLGQVEYSFDSSEKSVYRRQANYGQALDEKFGAPQVLARSVDNLKFRYYYLTDEGEKLSNEPLDIFPSGIEIEVQFSEKKDGQKVMRRYFNVLIGS